MRPAARSPPTSSRSGRTSPSASPQAWAKAVDYINKNPEAARKHLAKNTLTPDDVVDIVPMLGYIMTKDMTPKQLGYLQKFADFGTEIGVVPEKVDVKKYLKSF